MKKRLYYKKFMEQCIQNAAGKEVCIWGARRTGRKLYECALENNMLEVNKMHLLDRALSGNCFELAGFKTEVEHPDAYLDEKAQYYFVCAAENVYTAGKMNEILNLQNNDIDKTQYNNFWFYIEDIISNSNELTKESMEEYDNLAATLYTHQKYISDLIVDGEYRNVAPITTKIGCPIQCKYCPQDVLVKAYTKQKNPVMELSFKRFQEMLQRIPKDVIVSFTGFVEPFANPECMDMLMYALEEGYVVRLFSTLYNVSIGDYLRFKDHPNLKTLDIHLPDSQGNTKFPITGEYRATLRYVVNHPPKYARLWTSCLGVNANSASEIRDIISVIGNPINSIHGLVYDNRLSHGSAKLRCNRDCSRIDNVKSGVAMILPNGDATACTQDWELENVIGNIFDVSSWEELMRSEKRNEFRKTLSKPQIDNICTYCELAVEVDQGDKIE